MAASKLAADPTLQSLALEGEELGRKGAQRPGLSRALLTHGALRELDVACGNIGDAGMAYIAGAMQRRQLLARLSGIFANGVRWSLRCRLIPVGPAVAASQSSLVAWRAFPMVFTSGVMAIAKVLGKGGVALRDLDLSSARSAAEDAWVEFGIALSGCRLASLKLRQNPGIGDVAAEAFAQSLSKPDCSLSELDLSFCSLRSGCARILGAGHSLRQLQLFGNVAGPEAAEAFGVAASAGVTWLSQRVYVEDEAQLQDLDLSRCHLGGSAGAAMAAALRCRGTEA
eukprot:s831_g10.t1